MNQPKEIFVRTDRCMGCHSCETACAVEHSSGKSLYSAMLEKPAPRRRVFVEWVAPDKSMPVLCRHCEDAPCMHACISGAISRTPEGVVVTDAEKCIGCWTCVMVCPFGVINRHLETHKAYRCDRCPGREIPACVDACPTNALIYRTADEFTQLIRRHAAHELASGQGG